MSIRFACTTCGKTLSAPDGASNARAKCPQCGAVSRVPDAGEASAGKAPAPLPAAPRPAERIGVAAAIPAARGPRVSTALRKTCSGCGADVTFAARSRAADGGFICSPCAEARKVEAAAAQMAFESLAMTSGNATACASCGASLAAGEAIDYEGRPNCPFCWSEQTHSLPLAAAPPPLLSAPARILPRPQDWPHSPRQIDAPPRANPAWWITGIAVIVLAVGIGVAFSLRDHASLAKTSSNSASTPIAGREVTRPAAVTTITPKPAAILYRQTKPYVLLRAEAESIRSNLRTDLIGEDSAYRGISRRSRAARDLLAVLVKIESLSSPVVVQNVDRLISAVNQSLVGEDSALRSAYKSDKAFFDLLGVWSNVLETRAPGVNGRYNAIDRAVAHRTADDDSAPRACSAYTGASVQALASIASALNLRAEGDAIAVAADRRNIGEDSIWRAASTNVDGMMQLLVLLLKHRMGADAAAEAKRIESAVAVETITEDSALREQSSRWDGAIDALLAMIRNP